MLLRQQSTGVAVDFLQAQVRLEQRAVVRSENHERVLVQSLLAEHRHDLADPPVHFLHRVAIGP